MPFKDRQKYLEYMRKYNRTKYEQNPEAAVARSADFKKIHPKLVRAQGKRRRKREKGDDVRGSNLPHPKAIPTDRQALWEELRKAHYSYDLGRKWGDPVRMKRNEKRICEIQKRLHLSPPLPPSGNVTT